MQENVPSIRHVVVGHESAYVDIGDGVTEVPVSVVQRPTRFSATSLRMADLHGHRYPPQIREENEYEASVS